EAENFNYLFCLGPDHWHKLYSIASGDLLSPKAKYVKRDQFVGILWVNWKPSRCKEVIAVGLSLHMKFKDKNKDNPSRRYKLCFLKLGLVGKKPPGYSLIWGGESSEHSVGGRKYTSELHLIHWKADKNLNAAEAFNKQDILAIVAVFLEAGY
uniref:Alpha-carbonic anhydrase domain-containing protein n=1 Tax=Ficedula albicollis TaxID=59894 RepID=U3JQR0_FICAL